jgi:hypothetical protein
MVTYDYWPDVEILPSEYTSRSTYGGLKQAWAWGLRMHEVNIIMIKCM